MNEEKEDILFENKNTKPIFKLKHKLLITFILLIVLFILLVIYMPVFNPIYKQSTFLCLLVFSLLYLLYSKSSKRVYHIAILYLITFIALFMLTTPIFWSSKYRDMIGDVKEEAYSQTSPNIDGDKIPVVDQELAQTLGDKMLGESLGLGSQYTVGEYYFITTKDDLAWVAPLEPRSFFKWFQNKAGSPGYIYVSATNPNDTKLVTNINGKDLKLKYTNNSYLLSNIKRHVYLNGNMSTGLTDFSFEIDDAGNPYWVVTTYAPSFNIFAGEQATGVITVDAQTGKVNKYKLDDEIPSWVERVWPTRFIIDQIANYGAYKNGWLNTKLTQKEMVKPTSGFSYIFMDGKPYLYTGLTSVQSDQSTVGMMVVSLRDKNAHFYKLTGATEAAAMNSAEGQVQQYKYNATFPILLNVYSQPTYFMTLKDNEGLIKKYAYVSVENYDVVGIGDTITKAQKDYYNRLKNGGKIIKEDTSKTEAKTKVVERINIVDQIAYIKFTDDKNIYICETDMDTKLYLTQPGDKIKFKASSQAGDTIQILEFENNDI